MEEIIEDWKKLIFDFFFNLKIKWYFRCTDWVKFGQNKLLKQYLEL